LRNITPVAPGYASIKAFVFSSPVRDFPPPALPVSRQILL
jgi:hypothetical protein